MAFRKTHFNRKFADSETKHNSMNDNVANLVMKKCGQIEFQHFIYYAKQNAFLNSPLGAFIFRCLFDQLTENFVLQSWMPLCKLKWNIFNSWQKKHATVINK